MPQTGNEEKKATRRKSRLWLILPVVLILAGIAFFLLQKVYVFAGGGIYPRSSTQLDLRGKSISAETYERLRTDLPDCEILWSVPVGGGRYDCTAESITLTSFGEEDLSMLSYFSNLQTIDAVQAALTEELYASLCAACPGAHVTWSVPIGNESFSCLSEEITIHSLSESDIPLFAYFENLRTVTAEGTDDYASLLALRSAYPELTVTWQVTIAGESFSCDAEEITASDSATKDDLEKALAGLPNLQTVHLPDTGLSESDKLALVADYPDVGFDWPVTILGEEHSGAETALSFAGRAITDAEYSELLETLALFPKLESVDMTDTGLSQEQLTALCERYPDTDVIWTFSLYGVEITTTDTFLDFTGIEMDSTDAVEAIIPYMHHLEKIDMTDTGFDDETLDAMNKRWDNVRVVWTMHITRYDIRTDTTGFIASVEYYGYFTDETIMKLAYCEDLRSLDLGHRMTHKYIDSLDVFNYLPQLEYLVLAQCEMEDLTALGSLKNLKFLEMILAYATDFTPLLNCTSLEHLNVCFNYYTDPQTNYEVFSQMKQLKRLYFSTGMVSEENIEKLREDLPDTEICVISNPDEATGHGWRYDESYYEMRDLLGMYYMGDYGGRQYTKIIDGEEIELDEEFLASQRTWVNGRGQH